MIISIIVVQLLISGILAHLKITGTLRRYHTVTFTFDGPHGGETYESNPFRNYKLQLQLSHGRTRKTYNIPGYFATDGNASESGATTGNKWRAHFTPEETGKWGLVASFRTGPDVAVNSDPVAGKSSSFDGHMSTFIIEETNKSGKDFRSKGILRYKGARYLKFDNGEYFLKGGADSPENLLGYLDFDGTYAIKGVLKDFAPHIRDWKSGDPTWRDGRGKGLIGALNYLASTGANAFSFITMNIKGDGQDVWPWIDHKTRDRYDVSKLDQWEKVFSHADTLGLFLHFKTQETENDLLLNNGDLGPERKLYYRELIARFGHHHALNWNLGEENNIWRERNDTSQQLIKSYIDYFHVNDAYNHAVVLHSFPHEQHKSYTPLLGSALDGISLQTGWKHVHDDTKMWVEKSKDKGKPWVVSNDEQNSHFVGVKPDGPNSNAADIRKQVLWGNLMAGGAGVEYYFGYNYTDSDLTANGWRSRDSVWRDIKHALNFFTNYIPFWEMAEADHLATSSNVYVYSKPGSVYVYYFYGQGKASIRAPQGYYSIQWYNPRTGGDLITTNPNRLTGPADINIDVEDTDWVLILKRVPKDI